MTTKSRWGAISALFITPDAPAPVQEPALEEEDAPEPDVVPVLVNALGVPEIVEGRPYVDIYLEAGVVPSAFPVEKLLAVIEGLANMNPAQIRMVIAAMDAADESWVISDPVDDAKAKIEVLRNEQARLQATVREIEAQGKADADAQDAELAATSESIKSQIEALQVQLQSAIAEVLTHKTAIDARIRSAREAGAREGLRLEAEASRLNRVPNTFGVALFPPSPAGK